MNQLRDVIGQVRSNVGDPMGDFCTDAYLIPKINTAFGARTTQFESYADSSFEERLRDVPNVPVGTTSLEIYQQEQMPNTNQAGPLLGLYAPITVEWKIKGQPDVWYVEAARTGKLPNVSPAAPYPPYLMQWEWRENVIYITPLMYPVDIRVRGPFTRVPLVQQTDKLGIHNTMYILVGMDVAVLIGTERNNAGWKSYADPAAEMADAIENILIKAEQATTSRIGREGGRARGRNGAGGGWL